MSSMICNIYVYTFYRNLEHNGSFYDCLLDSMARVQSVDDKTVFVIVGDANAHHSEWFCDTPIIITIYLLESEIFTT